MADLKKGRTSSKRSLALSATDWGRQSVCGWDELGVGEAPRHVVFSESVTATEPFTFFGEAFHHSHELIVESVLGCRKGNILGPGTILKVGCTRSADAGHAQQDCSVEWLVRCRQTMW